MPEEVPVGAGVRGGASCGGAGEELIAAEVLAGERGVVGVAGAGVGGVTPRVLALHNLTCLT